MEYQLVISKIKDGGLPALTGMQLTNIEGDEIKQVLDKRKQDIDEYYQYVVMPRIVQS